MTHQISADSIEATIAYLYLLAYCPPEAVPEFYLSTSHLRSALAEQAGLTESAYLEAVFPIACQKIVSFYQAKTIADDDTTLMDLVALAKSAGSSAADVVALQAKLITLAQSPKRARERNRLRKRAGCQYCQIPCQFGLFSLVSHPNYKLLQQMLTEETKKPKEAQNPINLLWSYTIGHVWRTLGVKETYMPANSLGNLAYCLLTMVMGKSRLAFPASEMAQFQRYNQAQIANWR